MIDVEHTTAGLTEAQRKAIINGQLDLLTEGQWRKLCKAGCAWYRATEIDLVTGHRLQSRRQLRPLGVAIRDYLKGKE